MSIVNTDIINKKAPKKSKKAIIMNPHNKIAKKEEHFEEETTTQHFSGFIPEELIANSKTLVIKGASMVAKSKQDIWPLMSVQAVHIPPRHKQSQ